MHAVAQIIPDRMTAQIEGDFVVFLIGMRINAWWKPWKWLPVFLAMPQMLKELDRLDGEETGFLGHNGLSTGVIVQYWRSFEHLAAYASAEGRLLKPAWAAFNRRMKDSRGDVGIWHETYLVRGGAYECVYSGMPAFGLGRVSKLVPATRQLGTAHKRVTENMSENP